MRFYTLLGISRKASCFHERKSEMAAKISFEDNEKWGQPVNGEQLLTSIIEEINHYCFMPDYAPSLVAAWALHAWTHHCFDTSPVLAFTAPAESGFCGKSTALRVVSALTPHPVTTCNISDAVFYRLIDEHRPTLLIDEADTFLDTRKGLLLMLKAGSVMHSAYHLDVDNVEDKIHQFSVWGPKALAWRGTLPDALAGCSIEIRLERAAQGTRTRRCHRQDEACCRLRQKAARWADDSQHIIKSKAQNAIRNLQPLGDLNDRERNNAIALSAIAESVGGDWPTHIRECLIQGQAFPTR